MVRQSLWCYAVQNEEGWLGQYQQRILPLHIPSSDDFPSLITVFLIFPRTSAYSKTAAVSAAQDAGRICKHPDRHNSHFQQQVPASATGIHIYSHYFNQPLRLDRRFSTHTMLRGIATALTNQCSCTTLPSTTRL